MTTTPATPASASPGDLLARARGGDADAFCALAAAEEGRLFRQAVAMCGETSVAEDLVAESLIGAWQGISRFDGRCRFSTWLYAILLRRHHKHLRRARSRPVALARVPGEERESMEQRLAAAEDLQGSGREVLLHREEGCRIRAALDGLPEEHREVLMLRFFEDASLAEIAAGLGLPLGTVKSRLHHGLEKLRERTEVLNLWKERRES